VVRRFELWPVAKVAFFFHLLCYFLTVSVLALIWLANDRLGTVEKIEKLFVQYGFGDNFKIHGDVLLRVVASVGAVFVGIATIATIALAFFYNGISLVFGGLVVSVLEERLSGSTVDVAPERNVPAPAPPPFEVFRAPVPVPESTPSAVVVDTQWAPPATWLEESVAADPEYA
jgi:Transmembrane domain of unknown function (DUF3566)